MHSRGMMKKQAAIVNAFHAAPGGLTESAAGFRFDLLTSKTGERSLRIRTVDKGAAQPVELIVAGSQAYQFMEAVIHYVATMEKIEMQRIARGKRKATVRLPPHDQ